MHLSSFEFSRQKLFPGDQGSSALVCWKPTCRPRGFVPSRGKNEGPTAKPKPISGVLDGTQWDGRTSSSSWENVLSAITEEGWTTHIVYFENCLCICVNNESRIVPFIQYDQLENRMCALCTANVTIMAHWHVALLRDCVLACQHIFVGQVTTTTDLQENMWARLRESRARQGVRHAT